MDVAGQDRIRDGARGSALTLALATAGSAIGGPAAWVLPAFASLGAGAVGAVADRRQRLERFDAEVRALISDEALAAALERENVRDLLVQALEAAARAASEHKLRALARVFADGVAAEDQTEVDVQAVVVDTLSELETLHVRLLATIEHPVIVHDGQNPGVDRNLLTARQPPLQAVATRLIEDCVRLGLIYDTTQGTFGPGTWLTRRFQLTDFGQACLDHLREMAI